MNIRAEVAGIKKLQQANRRRIAALQPTGKAGAAMQWGLLELQKYQIGITHVDTGTLRASRRIVTYGNVGRLFTDFNAINPKSGVRAWTYDPYEEARGGSHASWQRTFSEAGPRVATRMTSVVLEGLK